MPETKKNLINFREEAEKFICEMPALNMGAFNPEQEAVVKLINLLYKIAEIENYACYKTAKKYHVIEYQESDERQKGIVRGIKARYPNRRHTK